MLSGGPVVSVCGRYVLHDNKSYRGECGAIAGDVTLSDARANGRGQQIALPPFCPGLLMVVVTHIRGRRFEYSKPLPEREPARRSATTKPIINQTEHDDEKGAMIHSNDLLYECEPRQPTAYGGHCHSQVSHRNPHMALLRHPAFVLARSRHHPLRTPVEGYGSGCLSPLGVKHAQRGAVGEIDLPADRPDHTRIDRQGDRG